MIKMVYDTLKSPLRGIVPPMVTPLADSDRLDVEGLERLIEHIISGGVHGLFILGTTGEASALSGRLRREMIYRTCKQVANRIPVLVGVTDTSVVESIELARYAAGVGAHAAVIASPFYLPLDQRELIGYARQMVSEQPLPVMLYNIPQLTKTWYEYDTLSELVNHPRIIGIKDSSGDAAYLSSVQAICAARPSFSVLVGTEMMMSAAVRNGVHGAVAGGAIIFPRLLVRLYEAAVNHDLSTVDALQQQLAVLGESYQIGGGASGIIKAIKCALGHLRICSERMADPFLPLSVEDRKKVRLCLERIDRSLAVPVSKKGQASVV
jgi:dihydrodipicolinate synthase/N-acetylneuraminate lyase